MNSYFQRDLGLRVCTGVHATRHPFGAFVLWLLEFARQRDAGGRIRPGIPSGIWHSAEQVEAADGFCCLGFNGNDRANEAPEERCRERRCAEERILEVIRG